MNQADVIVGRSELPRRLLILNADYAIVSAQSAQTTSGFLPVGELGGRLPRDLEQFVRATAGTWTRMLCPESRTLLNGDLAVRVFPLVGDGVLRIGVFIERYRVRAADRD